MVAPTRLSRGDLWGLVLAGGEGRRIEGYVRQLRGKSLPKQYVNFIGTRSMLQHTWDRAERLIPGRKILTIVTEHHLLSPEVCRQLAYRTPGTVIVQPENKDTGLGIFLPLTYLHKRCPHATVAVFPSDHFILEEDRFIDHVRLAARAVYHNPSQIVLLAVEAKQAEPDYGYVVFADESGQIDLYGCRKVAHFVEKPGVADARLLVAGGALWNTMIMVFRVETILNYIRKLFPDIAKEFRSFAPRIGTAAEQDNIRQIYRHLSPLNFSKDILEKIAVHGPGAVTGLPVLQVTWSDWGTCDRLSKTLHQLGAESFATPEPVVSDRRAVRVAAEKNSAAISKIH
jgi:mannose-1-phosphate guanylyltransferase